MLEPNLPSQAEQEEHSLTHVPYRNWCRHCVRGRAEEHGHFRQSDMPSGVEIHLDHCFPGEEDQDFKLTILVARDRGTKMTVSSVAPSKTCGEFIAKRVVAFMKEIGADQGDITIKSDQEPALIALVREIGSHRAAGGGGRMVVESSPVGDSQGNGVVERVIKSVQGQIRVLRSALEDPFRSLRPLPCGDPSRSQRSRTTWLWPVSHLDGNDLAILVNKDTSEPGAGVFPCVCLSLDVSVSGCVSVCLPVNTVELEKS